MANSDPEIVFVDLDASLALIEAEETRAPRLGASDILRAARLADDPRRHALWRAARIATRIILERTAGPKIRGVDFEIAAGGRPALGAGMPQFSVSHTGGIALVAVSQIGPVGVDVEGLRPLSMNADRRRRIVAAAGTFASDAGFDADSDTDVLRAWVNLEAVAKARGSGIGVLLTEERVIGGAPTQERVAHAGLAVATLDVPAPYIAAVAAAKLPQSIPVGTFPSRADDFDAFLSRSAGR